MDSLKVLLLLSLISLFAAQLQAQSRGGLPPDDELYRKIASLDTTVFDAYNSCDLEKFGTFFTDDLEFYHD